MTRRLLVVCLAALGALALLVTPAAGQQAAPGDAYTYTADCLGRQDHLIVATLIDESGSLRGNDPQAVRVGAVSSALGTLARFGRGPGQEQRPEMEAMVAGFGTGFTPGPWTPLNRDTIGTVRQQVADFRNRDSDADTDFATALDGARKALADKEAAIVAAGRPRPCRLLLVFTDGVYDIESSSGPSPAYAPGIPRTDDARVEEAGRHYLCDPDGVVDQLRKADTVIMAVGLAAQPPPPGGPPDQTFLRSIAQGDGQSCGRLTSPPGVHLTAEGIQGLVDAFDNAIVNAVGGQQPDPSDTPTPVCSADEQDARCTRTFTLDRSLSEFHLLVDLGAPGIVMDLTGPDGSSQRLREGDDRAFALSGADLQVTPASDVDIVIDGTLPPGRDDWGGTWTARFVDETGANPGAVSRSRLTVFGGLTPTIDPLPEFRVGERADFPISVVDAAGSPTTPSRFVRSASVTAEIDGLGAPRPLPVSGTGSGGPYRSSFTVPADTTTPTLDLKLTLDVVTVDGLRLRPKVKTYRVPVLPPTGFPLLAPADLTLGTITGADPASGQITVTGSPGARGCVWFDGATFGPTPRDAGAVRTTFDPAATAVGSQVCVDPGQRTVVTVHAAPEKVRTGLVEGVVTARSTGADPAKVHVTTIPVRFSMEQPVNQPFFWGLFVALLLVGLLIPLVLLWLLNRAFAKFEAPGSNLQRAYLPVRVTPGAVTNTATSLTPAPGDLRFRTLEPGTPVTRCAEFDDRTLHFRRHVPLLPVLLPFASVSTATRHVFASGGAVDPGAGPVRLGTRRPWPPGQHVGRLPLAVANTWVFVVQQVEGDHARPDLPIPGVVGELTVYLPYGSGEFSPTRVQELLSDAVAALPAAVLSARGLRDSPAAAADEPTGRFRPGRRGDRADPVEEAAPAETPTFRPPSGSTPGPRPAAPPPGPPAGGRSRPSHPAPADESRRFIPPSR